MRSAEDIFMRLARHALSEPDYLPLFFRALKSTMVYVAGTADVCNLKPYVPFEPNVKVEITRCCLADGSHYTPFFSAPENLCYLLDKSVPTIGLAGRQLLELTRGEHLILNPNTDCATTLSPQQVEDVLACRYADVVQPDNIDSSVRVLIGEPIHYPVDIIDALTMLYINSPEVKRAYVSVQHDLLHDELPTLIIALVLDEQAPSVLSATSIILVEKRTHREPTKTIQLSDDPVSLDGIHRYFFTQCEPFYQRSWGSQLRRFKGVGHA